MMRYLPLAAAAVLLAVSGVVHGLWTARWGLSEQLQAAAARCETVPMKVGDWQGETLDMDPRQFEVAEAVGHLGRRYVHAHTGQEVTVLLVCGRAGPISAHPPEVCFAGAGYVQVADKKRHPLEADGVESTEFWTARFNKMGPARATTRLFWAWGDGDTWKAADNPRLAFGRRPVLYKLYVLRRLARPDEPLKDDPAQDFFRAFLPELHKSLSPAS